MEEGTGEGGGGVHTHRKYVCRSREDHGCNAGETECFQQLGGRREGGFASVDAGRVGGA